MRILMKTELNFLRDNSIFKSYHFFKMMTNFILFLGGGGSGVKSILTAPIVLIVKYTLHAFSPMLVLQAW